jgi:hypothetical protein
MRYKRLHRKARRRTDMRKQVLSKHGSDNRTTNNKQGRQTHRRLVNGLVTFSACLIGIIVRSLNLIT